MQDLWVNRKKKKKRKEKNPGNIPSLHKLVDGVTKLLRASALCRDKARRFSQIRTREKNYNRELSIDVKIASLWFTELNNSSTFPSFPNRKYEVVYTYAKNCS